ncbi:MAG: family 20 glycosylhydrolase [Candidatus Heimdallarchaeota archaeon]|nr:MAG: family 20 glycosylhydrolase [Candidatus Heimdallarchaeota archaeon]
MNEKLELLFPFPKRLTVKNGSLSLPEEIWIVINNQSTNIFFHAQYLQKRLRKHGIKSKITASKTNLPKMDVIYFNLFINELLEHPEGYNITINKKEIQINGHDKQGLFYGLITFSQILDLSNQQELPCLEILDWPDFPSRGVMLDVSRDKVPTMETIFNLVDLLSNFKINQLQLYMEHTFAYSGHEIVWKEASPFTGEEILALDEFCKDRYIELIPNQNSFGHFHRWLSHEPYRGLAECPEGYDHPFSSVKEPFSLNPIDPHVIDLLEDLYDQLLPHFSSDTFNVGLDETFDLGEGQSAEACNKRGKSTIYLEFLLKIYDLVKKRGKKMQFWADIIFQHPELIQKIPKELIPLIWGYEASHPFNILTKEMNKTGLSYYVCPGTSSWNSITGRTDNAFANLYNAGVNGIKNNAVGYLITDWGDHGHLQPLPFSYLGYLIGSGIAWNVNNAELLKKKNLISDLLDVHVFHDSAGVMGKLAYDLGNTYTKVEFNPPNNSSLFLILIFSGHQFSDMALENITIESLRETYNYIGHIIKSIDNANIVREDTELVKQEFLWAANVLKFACNLGITRLEIGIKAPLNEIHEEKRTELYKTLQKLIEQHKKIWLGRNRSGGLSDSVKRLTALLHNLE